MFSQELFMPRWAASRSYQDAMDTGHLETVRQSRRCSALRCLADGFAALVPHSRQLPHALARGCTCSWRRVTDGHIRMLCPCSTESTSGLSLGHRLGVAAAHSWTRFGHAANVTFRAIAHYERAPRSSGDGRMASTWTRECRQRKVTLLVSLFLTRPLTRALTLIPNPVPSSNAHLAP